MILAIRHFPDKKRPCIVLEEDNKGLILGYLTDRKREKWLRKALMMEDYPGGLYMKLDNIYDIDDILESEE